MSSLQREARRKATFTILKILTHRILEHRMNSAFALSRKNEELFPSLAWSPEYKRSSRCCLGFDGENMIKRRPSPATGVQQCSSARVGSAREARAATEEVSVNWKGEMHEVELCHV